MIDEGKMWTGYNGSYAWTASDKVGPICTIGSPAWLIRLWNGQSEQDGINNSTNLRLRYVLY